MAEKRFAIEYVQGNPTIFHIIENEKHIDEMKIVDLLNELSDENEQLKQSNKGLQSELEIFKEDVTYSTKIINKLNDENEELEQRIMNKDCLIQELQNALNTDYYKESQEYKRKFIRVCDELVEENELYRKLKKENEKERLDEFIK